MKNYPTSLISVIWLSSFCISTTVEAEKIEFDFNIESGIEYDSNVNVKALDTVANVGDYSFLIDAGLEAKWKANDKLNLKASYNYSEKNYQTYNDFSQDINTFAFDINYDIFGFYLGANHHYAKAKLASDPLMSLSRRSAYLGRIVGESNYLRTSYFTQEKDFINTRERNATSEGLDSDAYLFFNNLKSFVSFGIAHENEDALDNLFDNTGTTLRTRYSNTFTLWNKSNQLQLAWRYIDKNYSEYNPRIGEKRQDEQHTVEASWEIEINSVFSAIANIEYGNYQSNLDSANYRETKAGIQIKAQF